LNELRGLNEAAGKEIDSNRKKIDSMREAVDARQAIVTRLERDVGSAEQVPTTQNTFDSPLTKKTVKL
jgi:hypothetical protein